MRFIDEVSIEVESGAGGDGCVAFRREKHVPRGGPAGGDGGDGGDVVVRADQAIATLLDLRYQRHYRAARGQHGQGRDRYGRRGDSLIIPVPVGTAIYATDGSLVGDLVTAGQEVVVARGGKGGRGNIHFATSTRQAPREAEPGTAGERTVLRLELKLLAEVGLVGLPNAGKSTLLARVSKARPKIADYPFTTLVPVLGVVSISDGRSLVMADIPGLIAGAHQGAGLGTRFLRHIERTRVLVFLLDDRHLLEGTDGSPAEDLALLRRELEGHDATLLQKPFVIALNKIDVLPSERRDEIASQLKEMTQDVFPISAVSGEGVAALLTCVHRCLQAV